MASYYVDPSALGVEYSTYAASPTWASPQDGNGLGQYATSAAVSIGTIDCTSASASAGNTLTIAGAVLTCVASGATTNQFNAGTGSALVTNIVATINAATNVTTSTFSQAQGQLQYTVFARANPGNANQVQIMSRFAGATWNSLSVFANSAWTGNPTLTQPSGGVDGPWAYMLMIGVFGQTATACYGLLANRTVAVTSPTTSDLIIVRTSRSSVNCTQTCSGTNGYTSTGSNKNIIFDNGTYYSGEPSTAVFTHNMNFSSANNTATMTFSGQFRMKCLTPFNYKMNSTVTGINMAMTIAPGATSDVSFEGVWIAEDSTISSSAGSGWINAVSIGSFFNLVTMTMTGCKVTQRFSNGKKQLSLIGQLGQSVVFTAINQTCEYYNLSSGAGPIVNLNIGGSISFIGCTFVDLTAGIYGVTTFCTNGSAAVDSNFVTVLNCTGITDAAAGYTSNARSTARNFLWRGPGVIRQDNGNVVMEYKSGVSGYPYLNTTLQDNTVVARKISWNTGVTPQSPETPLLLTQYNRLATASRNLAVELLCLTSATIKTSDLGFVIKYTDNTSVLRVEYLIDSWYKRFLATDTTLTTTYTSSASWTLNGVSGYTQAKLNYTPSFQILTNSYVEVGIFVQNASLNAGASIFVDPTVTIT